MKSIYSFDETRNILLRNEYWKTVGGQGSSRTVKVQDPRLYDSIYEYSKELETVMKSYSHYPSTYNFTNRIRFIAERNANIESLKCSCGRTYNWTGHCRHCSELKNTLSRATDTVRESRIQKQSLTMRKLIGRELQKAGKSPRYDLESIEILNTFGKMYNLSLQHAECKGEKYIEELGYWIDGYDADKNVVVEIDEPYHFRKGLILSDKDIKRHNCILEQLGCKIYRIYFNKLTGRVTLYNSPDNPTNWCVNSGIDLVEVEGIAKNGTKKYGKFSCTGI